MNRQKSHKQECFPVNPWQNSQSLNTTQIWRSNALGQAQGLCLSARSGVSVQASAMFSILISLQILKMNFTETCTATIVFDVPEGLALTDLYYDSIQ